MSRACLEGCCHIRRLQQQASVRSPASFWRIVPVYLLTIVFLVSHVSISSVHASKDACERAAEHARLATAGAQAVESARCEPLQPMAIK